MKIKRKHSKENGLLLHAAKEPFSSCYNNDDQFSDTYWLEENELPEKEQKKYLSKGTPLLINLKILELRRTMKVIKKMLNRLST